MDQNQRQLLPHARVTLKPPKQGTDPQKTWCASTSFNSGPQTLQEGPGTPHDFQHLQAPLGLSAPVSRQAPCVRSTRHHSRSERPGAPPHLYSPPATAFNMAEEGKARRGLQRMPKDYFSWISIYFPSLMSLKAEHVLRTERAC